MVHTTKDGGRIVVDTRMAALAVESGTVRVLEANRDALQVDTLGLRIQR